jgi:hypothetical protein
MLEIKTNGKKETEKKKLLPKQNGGNIKVHYRVYSVDKTTLLP